MMTKKLTKKEWVGLIREGLERRGYKVVNLNVSVVEVSTGYGTQETTGQEIQIEADLEHDLFG